MNVNDKEKWNEVISKNTNKMVHTVQNIKELLEDNIVDLMEHEKVQLLCEKGENFITDVINSDFVLNTCEKVKLEKNKLMQDERMQRRIKIIKKNTLKVVDCTYDELSRLLKDDDLIE